MSRVVHFEIQASRPQELICFYHALFGWSFNKWDGGDYWMIHTGPNEQAGINGTLLQRKDPLPEPHVAVNAFVITVDVDDLVSIIPKVGMHGGQIAIPKMPVPGSGWLAYAKDPEGNLFGMMQTDPNAA